MNKAIFLDRDGTINKDKQYLYRIEDFEFLPKVKEALLEFQKMGYLLIIVTNQSGIARGYYSEDEYLMLSNWLRSELMLYGVHIEKEYYCPHHENSIFSKYRVHCNCRKPRLGMYEKAIEEYQLDIENCIAVGDKFRDCAVALKYPMKAFLIGTNEKSDIVNRVKSGEYASIFYAKTLYNVAEILKSTK